MRVPKSPNAQWSSILSFNFSALFIAITFFSPIAVGLTYQEAIGKGNALYCLMSNTADGAEEYMQTFKAGVPVASSWTEYSSLSTWGWSDKANPEASYDQVLDNYIGTTLDLDTDDGIPVTHNQDEIVTVGNVEYPNSGGMYSNVFYVEQGLIVADENFSPQSRAPEFVAKGYPYVKLKQWSDVVFLDWQNQCSTNDGDITNLNYFIRFSIANLDAGSVIGEVTGGATIGGYKTPMKFNAGSDEFNALLGTPNGSGVAWFLINHKAQLGTKTLASISLFRSKDPLGGDPVTNMAFEVIDWSESS
ncbi:uncharacterized protein N7483_011765 [Penicillium malachiteum]|uniref:uncharacterized protein n=1 Tax=Penicillium malachiteum TaxID=1324776 RepID=UPI00254671A7|nr:uncharacterized protein N7483_011765 [Penicillium malachiteum]KAJ5714584.1 hypothetical protein N7483_011765 [Penicillium malachiteum]